MPEAFLEQRFGIVEKIKKQHNTRYVFLDILTEIIGNRGPSKDQNRILSTFLLRKMTKMRPDMGYLLYKEIKLFKSSPFFQKLLQFMHFYVTINYDFVTTWLCGAYILHI